MIVKVQVALAANVENPPILIYNESRSLMQTFDFEDSARLIKLMEGRPKAYFEAHIEDEVLFLDAVTEDQEW